MNWWLVLSQFNVALKERAQALTWACEERYEYHVSLPAEPGCSA
jgi:hypothetical protein